MELKIDKLVRGVRIIAGAEAKQRRTLLNGMIQLAEAAGFVGIALQEALSNAIHHGNLELDSELRQVDENNYYALADQRRKQHPYAGRKVYVEAALSRSELHFVITDEGPGFDIRKVLDPTAEVNLDRIGGRGLLLIRSFMDSVTYNECGNQITMTKHVSAVEPRVIAPGDVSRSQSALVAAACS